MKLKELLLAFSMLVLSAGCTMQLTMKPPTALDVKVAKQHSYTAGLYIPKEVREQVYVNQTWIYPLGEQTTGFFEKNLPLVFKNVVLVDSKNPSQDVPVIIEPSILKFNSIIPFPAYNPYTATMVYRVDVYDRKGEKIYTQTATGDAQTSKGLLSGFMAAQLLSEAAQTAMENAVRQIIEGLAEAQELAKL
jgi:hypothetical protein